MSLKSNFELMADYNQWMNENLYSAAEKLSNADLTDDRGAYFGSVIGSLNHILVGDTIWLKRFADHPSAFESLDYIRVLERPKTVDVILHSDLGDLHSARKKMDQVIIEFSSELTDAVLATNLKYKNTKSLPFDKKLGALVQHFFNHQTHHRGQISTLLNQSGVDIGVTDLLARIPN